MTARLKSGVRGAVIAILTVITLMLVAQYCMRSNGGKGTQFAGSDDQAISAIQALAPSYQPWFSSLYSPGDRAESLLFILQAALGGGFIGYYIGYSRGRKDRTSCTSSHTINTTGRTLCKNNAERLP